MNDLLKTARLGEKRLLAASLRFVGANLLKTEARNTRHFREWFRCPMSYARIMELPLTMHLLDAQPDERILDVSSPKLLALYYALYGYKHVVAADVEDYFVGDFDVFRRRSGIQLETAVFDAAKRIPYPDGHFDKIFSISVLEHIPGNGDTLATAEMVRALKSGGSLVLTLPAFSTYTEEWLATKDFYWNTVRNGDGRAFFQRRYDQKAVLTRISVPGAKLAEVVLVAEKPLADAHLDSSGKMLHNCYYVDRLPSARLIRKWGRRLSVLPFTTYLAEKIASSNCHYLTDDWNDPNIRQVVLKLTRE
jgi:2-polyprenyl-3-methyl-5-hydroxy-6-metoxy-1,4-benzoquinol methylase